MNDFLSAEPTCFETTSELKALLDLFGPTTGRYHLSCPNNWQRQVEQRVEAWGEVKKAKAHIIIRRAIERGALIENKGIEWNSGKTWVQNIEFLLEKAPKLLKYIIIADLSENTKLTNAFQFEDLELPPTEEEKISATPEEFVRVSTNILTNRPELIFIDPFLNPCSERVRPILEALFGKIAGGRCESIKFWVRDKALKDSGSDYKNIRFELEDLARKTANDRLSIEFISVDDRGCNDKLHARYLLSLKGGIRFDQGFQILKKGVTVDVSPIGSNILDELVTTFIEGSNDLKIVKRIRVR